MDTLLASPQPLSAAPPALLAGIRLLATDIDDTMTHAGVLTPAVVAAVARLVAAGIEVLPVSGRSAGEVLGLARYLPGVRRAIAENGATLLRPDNPPLALRATPDRVRLREAAAALSRDLAAPLVEAADAFCRVGDLAFERGGRADGELQGLHTPAAKLGVFLLWSSVHLHLSLAAPDKGAAVLELAAVDGIAGGAIATIGDSPNDAGLWVPGRFALPVGTAAVMRQRAVLPHLPQWVVGEGALGWVELAEALLAARK
ncbi:MAG: hypothetical protein EXR79_06860 [Myxococcales bacterium]|nr:hypothetical protein [Myxococcales bacterium]